MKFGDKKWFETLEAMVTFPKKFSFFYNKKSNRIYACVVDTRAQLDNIRWKDLRPSGYLFVPNDSALITVREIQSSQQYYDEMSQLIEEWDAVTG